MRKLLVFVVVIAVLVLSACRNNAISCSNCGESVQKNAVFCSKCGCALNSANNETIGQTDASKELTRDELISQLGGILEVSCEQLDKYCSMLYYTKFHIEGTIKKAEYNSFYETNEYELKAGYDEITIHSTQGFSEGDYVYVTVLGLTTYHGVDDKVSISKSKTSEAYLTTEEYFDIHKALEKTRFKVTGYLFDSYVDFYGDTIYRMYDSEDAYKADSGGHDGIRIEFADKQANIMGKKIQVMGELWSDGLHKCSIVSN